MNKSLGQTSTQGPVLGAGCTWKKVAEQ